LNVNPNAFLFNQINAGAIVNRSTATNTGLEVPPAKSLLLVGGDVRLEGGRLFAPGGRVELGGIAGTSTVELNVNGSDLSLSFPNGTQFSDVLLTNRAVVNVTAGGGGSITVNARNLEVLEGSRLLAGIGEDLGIVGAQAGDITLNATGEIIVGQSSGFFSSRIENNVNRNATGNGGNINIQAESLFMSDGSRLSTNASGQGDAGSIFVRVSDAVNLIDNSYIDSSAAGNVPKVGDGGDIQIQAGSLSMNRAGLSASIFRSGNSRDGIYGYGQGNGGSITVQVEGAVDLMDSSIASILGTAVTGKGGDIKIKAKSLSMTDEAILTTRTNGQGNAGDISVEVEDTISLTTSNINSFVNFYGENYRAVGNGGDIKIKAGSLFMLADAYISASTLGQGNAGDISVQVSDAVSLSNTSYITSNVNTTAVGEGGNIQIEAASLLLSGDAVINTSTNGRGNAGNIQVNASNSVSISGVKPGSSSSSYGGLFTDSDKTATGQGGNISITTGALRISDRASLNARTNSAFRGGNITVDANTVDVTNGGKLVTTAFSSGGAGDININSTDSITISGSDPTFARRRVVSAEDGPASGLFARTRATGSAGSLTINTGQLQVLDGAEVTVSGESGQAGNLDVTANSILLNRGKLTAVTGLGEGGNITLQELDLLRMRDNSLISANGGNINIDSNFILAIPSENTDITANAFEGSGGNINITAQGIFGLQYRDRPTPTTSDINPRSEFGVDGGEPNQGLSELPVVPVDTQVSQACTPGSSQAQSEFIVTGRGGLPQNPGDVLNTDAVQVDLVTLNPQGDRPSTPSVSTNSTSLTSAPIVEAQSWAIDKKGNVVLIASSSTHTAYSSWQKLPECNITKSSS
jgi:large exoprotein involved in heme utilization and adhesion